MFQGLGQSALPRATCRPILSCPEYFLHIPTLISLPSESPGGLVKRTVSQTPPQGALANTLGAGIRHFTFKTLVPVTLWVSQAWGLSPLSCPTIPESWHARSRYRNSTCSASTSETTSSLKSSVSSAVENGFFSHPIGWPFGLPFIFSLLDYKFLECRECVLFLCVYLAASGKPT